MKRLVLAACLMTAVGCATGKVGNVETQMQPGAISKTTPIMVETISAKDTFFSGDKSGDKQRTEENRTKIESQFNRMLVDALNKRGFNAKIATGPVKSGVVLSGTVTKVENGSAAARYFVGMGAGSANMFTDFKLEERSATPKTLAKFQIIATSGAEQNVSSYMDRHLADGSSKTAEYLDKSLNPAEKK